MGLFKRAHSVLGKSVRTGLLARTQQLPSDAARPASYPYITQDELDALLERRGPEETPRKDTRRAVQSPPGVPLTWHDAGLASSPPFLGPTIEPAELKTALSGGAAEHSEDQELIYEVSRLKDGLEAPAELFSQLQAHLQLTAAALLLYDPLRMVYAPWASCGYDQTTQHRLRIPTGLNEEFDRVAQGEMLALDEAQQLARFRGCFSSRSFSRIRELILVPFIAYEKLLAVLLVTSMARPYREVRGLLAVVAERAAPLLYRAREEKLQLLRREPPGTPSALVEDVRSFATTCQNSGRRLILIRLSFQPALSLLERRFPAVDSFRLREDLGAVVSSLSQEIGSVYRFDRTHLLLLVHGMAQADPELLLHQISMVVRGLFHELSSAPVLEAEHRTGTDPEQAVRALSELV